MMELLVSASWLVVVVAAIVALLRNHRRTTAPLHLWLTLGALVCIAIVLFPSISISDDLHFDSFIVEDSNSSKRLTQAAVLAHSVSPLFWYAIAFSAFRLFAHVVCSWHTLENCSSQYR